MKNPLPICLVIIPTRAVAGICHIKAHDITSCAAPSFDMFHGVTEVTHGVMLLVFTHALLLGFEIDMTAHSLPHEPIPEWFSIANLIIEAWPQVTETAV